MRLQCMMGLLVLIRAVLSNPLEEAVGAEVASGVEVVWASELEKLVAQHPKVLLFFGEKNCANCLEYSESYAVVNQQHPEAAHYTKMYFSNTTHPIFIEYNITDFPRIVAFINGKQSPYQSPAWGPNQAC